MARWAKQWLTENERKHLQVGQQGIRARQRIREDAENRGYPKSSIPISQTEKRPDTAYETSKQIKKKAKYQTRKALEDAFKKKGK